MSTGPRSTERDYMLLNVVICCFERCIVSKGGHLAVAFIYTFTIRIFSDQQFPPKNADPFYLADAKPTTRTPVTAHLGVLHGKWINKRLVEDKWGERAPLASAQLAVWVRLVARIPGSPPVVSSVHWPVHGLEEKNWEAEHECWSKFSQCPAALQINPPTAEISVPALFQ